jgi:uncharacterized membrane protein YbhN (UPF0104 family)
VVKSRLKKLIKLTLQIALTLAAIWLLLSKVSAEEIASAIGSSHPLYLFLAFLAFNLSKIISSIRLNRFFADIGLHLSESYNLALYYLGMFYNLFLPGGIGGDGYKVYVLHKRYDSGVLRLTKAILLDRISGLIALSFFAAALIAVSSFAQIDRLIPLVALVGAVAIYPLTLLIYRYWFQEFLSSFTETNIQAVLVQLFQLLCAYWIIVALGINSDIIDLLAIFLISSVVAVIPFTVGGVGARELTFLYLLGYIGGNVTGGVTLSVLFFLITALSSLLGAVFIHKKW